MPTDQTPATPDEVELAEYQVWDRVERRLWSRARLILAAAVVVVLLVVLLGVPLAEERLERRVIERAEALIDGRVTAVSVDVPAIRREIREETQIQKQQLLASQFALEKRIAQILERSKEIETATDAYEESARESEKMKGQLRLVQQTQKNEQERLHKLRTNYEKELTDFRQEVETIVQNTRKMTARELSYVEHMVDSDLDELRPIADQMAGKPAIFSTYMSLDHRVGQITGLNFGDELGAVFVRVRAFTSSGEEPFAESDSIRVQVTEWTDSRIELRIPAPAMEKIQEAQLAAGRSKTYPPEFRYGFLIQTDAGKMSQWSAKRAHSTVPPVRVRPHED